MSCTVLCSLGAALANIFTAALVVPETENQKYEPKFGALCTLGQPRVGNAVYSNALENVLSADRMHRRCATLSLPHCRDSLCSTCWSAVAQLVQHYIHFMQPYALELHAAYILCNILPKIRSLCCKWLQT